MPSTKIIHINTYDILGGASRAAYRLHISLRQSGIDSSMFVLRKISNDPSVFSFIPPMEFPIRLRRRLRRELIDLSFLHYKKTRPNYLELFTDDRSEHGLELLSQIPTCDLINLHWIAGTSDVSPFSRFLDIKAFLSSVPNKNPVVWTLHDMNAFTGGCHYDLGCGKYLYGCGRCPQLGSNELDDISRQIWNRKLKAFSLINNDRLHIVSPSIWLAEEVKRSPLLKRFPVSVIPYALDTKVFSPIDAAISKKILEIPQKAKTVLFVASPLIRKGLRFLIEALSEFNNYYNINLISIGSYKPDIHTPFPYVHFGHISNNGLLSLFYSAADVFVIPSIQDNLPNVVLESMACGTPVVGFSVGGIPDMVRPGVTGLLAMPENINSLRTVIFNLLTDDHKMSEMSANCLRIATNEYSLEVQANKYINLYESILEPEKQYL